MPTEALIAQMQVGRYASHQPLYRQAQIYARQGIQLYRSTLAVWVGREAWYPRPFRDHILERLQRSGSLAADQTTAPVLDPGRGAGGPRTGGFGPMPATKAHRAVTIRRCGYAALARRRQQIQLAFCWAHVRRKLYELPLSMPPVGCTSWR